MSDQVIPKVPTSYEGTAKEEPSIPKAPTSYDATAKEEPESPTASDTGGN